MVRNLILERHSRLHILLSMLAFSSTFLLTIIPPPLSSLGKYNTPSLHCYYTITYWLLRNRCLMVSSHTRAQNVYLLSQCCLTVPIWARPTGGMFICLPDVWLLLRKCELLLTFNRAPMPRESILSKFSLMKHWVYLGYLQDHRWLQDSFITKKKSHLSVGDYS